MVDGAVSSPTTGAVPATGNIRSLVLRAWREPGIPPRLTARVVEITPGRDERHVIVTTSVDEACRAVRTWLEALQGTSNGGNGDGQVTHRR